MLRVLCLIWAGFFIQGVSFQLSAANQDEHVETIIVSATRSDVTDIVIPSSITVISAEDIQQSGATHLVDALRIAGGLHISDLYGDGTDASVGLRGFSETAQQNTLIMIDGRRLNNADNGLPDLNTVALKNIERIEIIKGSSGTLYGDKAVGGVINIITSKPESLRLQVETKYGSYDNRSLFVSIENRYDSGIQYRLSVQRHLSDNYRDNNVLQLTDVALTTAYEHDSGEVFMEYQKLNENIKTPGALFSDLLVTDRQQTLNPTDFIDTDSRIIRIGVKQNIISGIEVQMEYTNRQSETVGQLSSGGFPSPIELKREHTEFTPRLIASFDIPTGHALVTLGADLFETDYLLRSNFGLTDDIQTQYSIYAQAVLPLSEKLFLTIGARHGRVENDILVDTLAFGRSLPEGTEIGDSANAYEAGLSYNITDDWRVFGKLDRNYRFVTADEYSAIADNNFFTNLFSFGTIVPLPVTQTGLSYEIGTEWQGEKTGIKLQFYQLDLDEEIVFDPVLFVNRNIGDTQRRGIILEGRHTPVSNWDIYLNYSYIDAEITSGNFDGSALTFISDHTASISSRYRYNEHLSGYLEFRGVSARVFGGDFANTFSKLPGYAIANLNLSYQYKNYTMSLRVNNLLDKEYSDSGNIGFDFRVPFPSPQVGTFFPAPKRNFLLSLQYTYQ